MKLDLPQSRIDVVLEAIRRGILTHELRPGQALVEAELASQFGVSKTPVREALKILSHSGLVQSVAYKGMRVQTVDGELIRSVRDLRLLVEPEAVRRAVSEGPAHYLDEAGRMLETAREMIEEGEDRAGLSLVNRDFHALLYAGCGNPLMRDVMDNLRDRTALISVVAWHEAEDRPQHPSGFEWDEHRDILAAARAGDAERAASLTAGHISRFFERVLDGSP
ncbi:GntR family transcriptional regulator [Citricoccus sp.]|uniref:GntR family transcriptional regulator n=1 Tax=Citricoccus sp. TaxID=1978372 RepID=UPI0028BD4AAF|nr:GntR family transcriptional regulator [Citricoccus sp.]